MDTNRITNRSETVRLNEVVEVFLSDEALDHVVGGLNPQPLPPCQNRLVGDPPDPWGIW
ncbi:MAG TPA: hypothetical protein VII14_16765 [Xanthobacteraceae bacterium]|jgi:hypothetical protein